VAAAGSLALYNRHRLHEEALRISEASWSAEGADNLRHYALTFVGPEFSFWVLRPSPLGIDGKWSGCGMTRLCGADCMDEYGVKELVGWINEINRWGLSSHGPSCERDIKTILRGKGVRTSDIRPTGI